MALILFLMDKLETIKPLLLLQREECGFLKELEWKRKKEFSMVIKCQLWSLSRTILMLKCFIQVQQLVIFIHGKGHLVLKLSNFIKVQLWDWPMHQESSCLQDQRIL